MHAVTHHRVLLVDLPDGGASDKDNAILTEAAEELSRRYPAMFKPSHNCRPPHLNLDLLREQVHRAELISRLEIRSSEQLLEWFETANRELGARSDYEWSLSGGRSKSGSALSKALSKARENGLFLGMEWDWLQK